MVETLTMIQGNSATEFESFLNKVISTCEEIGCMDYIVRPYSFGIKVRDFLNGHKDYRRCTRSSQSVIRAEIRGFLSILNHWIELYNEDDVTIMWLVGKNKGQTGVVKESIAKEFIEMGMVVEYLEEEEVYPYGENN